MATIQIKNIGPITDTGIIPLTSVMLVIGKQSSGKSTFLKILCFCRWMEKLIMVSDEEAISQYTHNLKFLKSMKQFHRFNDSYFSSASSIRYEGDTITITMENILSDVKILRKPEFETVRYNTKLSFIPSERNLVSVIRNIDQSYRSAESDVLFNYIFEWGEAKDSYTAEHPKRLSFTDNIEYINDGVMADYFTGLVGKNASVSKHDLANTLARYLGKDKELTNEMLKSISNKMKYQSVQLFIEEPEQNLYPDSQRNLTINLVCALKQAMPKGRGDSMLVMTTHSPYILSTLNVLIAEAYAMDEKPKSDKLRNIVNKECLFPLSAYSAYYIQEDGKFADIIDKDITMISGNELDGVSDWVDDKIARINAVLYGED